METMQWLNLPQGDPLKPLSTIESALCDVQRVSGGGASLRQIGPLVREKNEQLHVWLVLFFKTGNNAVIERRTAVREADVSRGYMDRN